MNQIKNKKLTKNAQNLRKNMTKEERHLWYDFLKQLPVTFHRQKTIDIYIVDFCCPSAKLVIELDGGQHYEAAAAKKDAQRDRRLAELGFLVLRYTNLDISNNFDGVCQDILIHLNLQG